MVVLVVFRCLCCAVLCPQCRRTFVGWLSVCPGIAVAEVLVSAVISMFVFAFVGSSVIVAVVVEFIPPPSVSCSRYRYPHLPPQCQPSVAVVGLFGYQVEGRPHGVRMQLC